MFAVAVCSPVAFADDQTLSPIEQRRLEQMDQASVQAIYDLCVEIDEWQRVIDSLNAEFGDAKQDAAGLGGQLGKDEDVFDRAITLAEFILERRETFERFVAIGDRLDRSLTTIQTAGQGVVNDPFFGTSLEELRGLARQMAKIETGRELAVELRRIVDVIKALKNPAEFMKRFLDSEFTRWMEEPRTFDDVTFQILKSDRSVPVFSPAADLSIVLQYQKGLSLKASGLYFKYREGLPPEPRFDKVRADKDSLNQLLNAPLKYIGEVVPENLDLPIAIRNLEFNHGQRADVPPCSLSFDVQIDGPFDFAPGVAVEGEDVVIDTKGNVSIDSLGYEDRTLKIPLGTTTLIMDGYSVVVRPDDWTAPEAVTIGTDIITPASRAVVVLNADMSFGFPIDLVKVRGDVTALDVANQPIRFARFEGELAKTHLEGELFIPAEQQSPLRHLIEGKFDVLLDSGGFQGTGDLTVLQSARSQYAITIQSDGHSRFETSRDVTLLGLQAKGETTVTAKPGFSEVALTATCSGDFEIPMLMGAGPVGGIFNKVQDAVPGPIGEIPEFTKFHATIGVDASTARNPAVLVKATANGVEVQLKKKTLGVSIEHELAMLLAEQVPQMIRNGDEGLADLERAVATQLVSGREAAVTATQHWESVTRKTISENLAKVLTLPSINPEVDKVLGHWSTTLQNTGGQTSQFIKDQLNNVGNAGAGLKPEDLDPTGLFRGFSLSDPPVRGTADALEPASKDALFLLADAIKQVVVSESAERKQDFASREFRGNESGYAHVHATVNRAGYEPIDGRAAIIPFTFSFSSASSQALDGNQTPALSSGIRAGAVHFRDLTPNGSGIAKIVLTDIDDKSGLGLETLLRDELQDLIERYLPLVQVEGNVKRYAAGAIVDNNTDQELAIRYRMYRRTATRDGVSHRWHPIHSGEAWYNATLPPNSSLTLINKDDKPQTGTHIRLWGNSPDGRLWDRYRRDVISLMPNDNDTEFYRAPQLKFRRIAVEPDDLGEATKLRVPPEVVGMALAAARTLLKDAGFDEIQEQELMRVTELGKVARESKTVYRVFPREEYVFESTPITLAYVHRVTEKDESFEMPALPKRLEQAESEVARLKLKPSVEVLQTRERVGETASVINRVVKQRPKAGAEVRPGDEVVLFVERVKTVAKRRLRVPDGLVGRSLEAARQRLADAGFRRVGDQQLFERTVYGTSESDASIVYRVYPKDEFLPESEPITLAYVRQITLVDDSFVLPRLSQDLVSAENKLRELNLHSQIEVLVRREREGDEQSVTRRVVRHQPEAGATVSPGDTVTLYVEEIRTVPKQRFRMPSLIEHTRAEAEQILKQHGLKLGAVTEKTVRREGDKPGEFEYVVEQTPAAGALTEPGCQVDLTVVHVIVEPRTKLVRVPRLHPDIKRAEVILRAEGLRVGGVVTQQTEHVVGDRPHRFLKVTGSDPAAGTEVAAGTAVTLHVVEVIVEPPREVTLPDLRQLPRQDPDSLRARLANLGLAIQVQIVPVVVTGPPQPPRFEVKNQRPPPGVVPIGTVVEVQIRRIDFRPEQELPRLQVPPFTAYHHWNRGFDRWEISGGQQSIARWIRNAHLDRRSLETTDEEGQANGGPARGIDGPNAPYEQLQARILPERGETIAPEDGMPHHYYVITHLRTTNPEEIARLHRGELLLGIPKTGEGFVFFSADGGRTWPTRQRIAKP